MDDIREYLNKKLYNAKKTTVAIALCTAATLSMTGCGSNDLKENVNSQAQIENPIEDTLNEKNIYRLYTEKGYKDFEIRKINKCGSAQSGAIVDYYSTDGYIIAFENNQSQYLWES